MLYQECKEIQIDNFILGFIVYISFCYVTKLIVSYHTIDWLSWVLTTCQPLWVILCRLPEKGRKEIEEIVEEMKERDRKERGTGMKVKKKKK